MDTRFERKIENPLKGRKWADTTKRTQANETTGSEHNIQSKKTYKYVAPSSYTLFKANKFFKISDNSTKN